MECGWRKGVLVAQRGGLGFQSAVLTAPASHTAAWHVNIAKIACRLGCEGVAGLASISPWVAKAVAEGTPALQSVTGHGGALVGDPKVSITQRCITAARTEALKEELLDSVKHDVVARASLRSAGGPGAGEWLSLPREPSHHFLNLQFSTAVRLRLHMDIPGCSGQCQHRSSSGAICGAELDKKGFHARTCPIGGWVVRKHDACCGVLREWLEDHGCLVEREVILPGASEDLPEARMDLVAHAPGISGPMYIDLTIVSAASREALSKGAASTDGAAARSAAARKRAKYPQCPVTPFVIEDHGRLGEEALSLVRKIAPKDAVARSAAIRRLHQSLGATVQRCAADAIIAAIPSRPWAAVCRARPQPIAQQLAAALG